MPTFRFRFICAVTVMLTCMTYADSHILPSVPPDRWAADVLMASTETGEELLIQIMGLYQEAEIQIGDLGGREKRQPIKIDTESAKELFLSICSFIDEFSMVEESSFSDNAALPAERRYMASVAVLIGRKRISTEMYFSDMGATDKPFQDLVSTVNRLLQAQGVQANLFLDE